MALLFYPVKKTESERKYELVERWLVDGTRLHSPAVPDMAQLDALGELLTKSTGVKPFGRQLLPEGTLWIERFGMAFYQPGGVREMHIRRKEDKPRRTWVPPMVFTYKGPKHDIRVHWCSGDIKDVRENAKVLFPAPMPNMDKRGNLCIGSSMQGVTYTNHPADMQEIVLERFWSSTFNEWRSEHIEAIMNHCMDIADDPEQQATFFSKPIPALKAWLKQAPLQNARKLWSI